MTEQELDSFFIETLNKALAEMKISLEYIKDIPGDDYDDVRSDYKFMIEDLSSILKNVKSINDLAEMDDETIGAVFDYIEMYAEGFVISNEPGQKEKDMAEYEKIQTLMDLFYDEDDDLDDDDDQEK